jgi:hypothetical protein
MTATYNTCDGAKQGITVGAGEGPYTNVGSVVSYNVIGTHSYDPSVPMATAIDQEGSTTPASMTGNIVNQPLTGNYVPLTGGTTAGYTAAPAGQ